MSSFAASVTTTALWTTPCFITTWTASSAFNTVAKEDMKSPDYYRHLSKQGTLIFDPLSTKIMSKSGGEYLSRPHHVFSMKEMLRYILFRQFCAEYGRDVDEAAGE